MYKNIIDSECSFCHSECAECDGPYDDNCTKCVGSLYLVGTSCVTSC